jgi:predicted RNA-binding Zn ribbon-like protein
MLPVTFRLGTDAALGLANSAHGPGAHYRRRAKAGDPRHDHLDTPSDAAEFLSTHSVPAPHPPPTARQLARLRELRAIARALADDPALDLDSWRAVIAAALVGVDFRLRPDGTLRSGAPGWDGVADDLLPAVLALAAERDRLRHCGNALCTWLFIDRSARGDRRWCEAAVCGNRVRVGRHRRRPEATLAAASS